MLPNWASAAMRLDQRLPRFPVYRRRALAVAAALCNVPGVHVLPEPPQVNLFHLLFEAEKEPLLEARDRVAEQWGLWLFGNVWESDLPGWWRTEIYVGEGALNIEDAEVTLRFNDLIALARDR
jgi:hypothetical protein